MLSRFEAIIPKRGRIAKGADVRWRELLTTLTQAVAMSPYHHLHTNYPVTSDGIVADIVVEGPEEVVVLEALRPMAGTALVSTTVLPMASMARDSAEQVFPGKNVRTMYYPMVDIPESVKDVVISSGAEIVPQNVKTIDFVRNTILKK